MKMEDFEEAFTKFLTKRFGKNWSYEWEVIDNGLGLTSQVWPITLEEREE